MNEYKHTNRMNKRKNVVDSAESVKEPALKIKEIVKTKFPIKAPETLPQQGTKGAPNWALKQQHCIKFPDGGPQITQR